MPRREIDVGTSFAKYFDVFFAKMSWITAHLRKFRDLSSEKCTKYITLKEIHGKIMCQRIQVETKIFCEKDKMKRTRYLHTRQYK